MVTAFIAAMLLGPETLRPAPINTFNGDSWSGIKLGTPEADLKRTYATSKTALADPASVQLKVSESTWMVHALVSKQGGKGNVVGMVAWRPNGSLMSLNDLTNDLGDSDTTAYPRVRYSSWWIESWASKGIVAVVGGRDNPVVYQVVMGDPEQVRREVDQWPTRSTSILPEPKLEVDRVDARASLDVNTDDLGEVLLAQTLRREAERELRRYNGPGMVDSDRGNGRINVTISVKQRDEDKYELSVSATATGNGPVGQVSATATASDTAKRAYDVMQRVSPLVERVYRTIGSSLRDNMKTQAWQAEYRPLYNLTRS